MKGLRLAMIVPFVGDAICVALAVYCALVARFGTQFHDFGTPLGPLRFFTGAVLANIGLTLFVFYCFELYDPKVILRRLRQMVRIAGAVVTAGVILSVLFYWAMPYRMYRLAQVMASGLTLATVVAWREIYFSFVFRRLPGCASCRRRRRGRPADRAGPGQGGQPVYEMVGFVDDAVRGSFGTGPCSARPPSSRT